jgi:hypothetical protein
VNAVNLLQFGVSVAIVTALVKAWSQTADIIDLLRLDKDKTGELDVKELAHSKYL